MDCPRLPSDVRREAIANRDAYYKQSTIGVPTPGAYPRPNHHPVTRRSGMVPGEPHPLGADSSQHGAQFVHAVDEVDPGEEGIEDGKIEIKGAENAPGGN
jgi:hypothetical protein